MIAWDNTDLCSRYAEFYYDFLYHRAEVPENVRAHFEGCPDCRKAIQRLKSNLESEFASSPDPRQTAVMTNLELHLAYVGKAVTCREVRPFLPSQADPSLKVRVSTPITIHIDHCDSCKTCLTKLEHLHLNPRQLCRLSQMMVEAESAGYLCDPDSPALRAIAELRFQGQEPELLRHVSLCAPCRRRLYEYRQRFLKRITNDASWTDRSAVCEHVSNQDLFEYCFPYGMDPSGDEYAKFRPALLDHIRQCDSCLAKMQELHTLVSEALEEPASGLITRITLEETAGDDMCRDHPWHVETGGSADAAAVDSKEVFVEEEGNNTSRVFSLKTVIRPLAAAAVFLLIAYIVVSSLPSARARGLESLYKAISQAHRVYLQIHPAEQAEPLQEILVSRPEQICAVKDKKQIVFYDLANKTTRVKNLIGGQETRQSLSVEAVAKLNVGLDAASRIMPFANATEVPEGAQSRWISPDEQNEQEPAMTFFELTWTEMVASGQVQRFWRAYLDSEQGRPVRTERWEQIPPMLEAECTSYTLLQYPDEAGMKGILAGWGF
ncbi:MAG: hypothetical protein JW828_04295 [Sedimentisphaerales bacterium]|nr:hypothetical protein [Sedimentisphaerales bacterium]